ncbi:MAG: DNA photolyase [Candidatus Marinimicrobia bacterium]|nr:DNA photolyase [Candidatus Neomarinimicrobiota bacterium]MDP6611448.1 DNA photolyase [Candidatus Neomarinimicrobiota bacterium]
MSRSDNPFLPDFSHIYVETGAKSYALANQCLTRFPKAEVVEVPDYKSIFNRPGQDFQTQKKSVKLILAVKKPPFIYKSTDILQDGGFKNFYYNTPILNCLYNCDYCFLQGMYPSANVVVFVNQEDMQSAVEMEMDKRPYPDDPLMLSISYNTDLLTFENILPMTRTWIKYAKTQPDLHLEVRTKSALFSAIQDIEYTQQVLLAWTLSPDKVVKGNEYDTPPLDRRISALKSAMAKGWKVRLCFDSVLVYPGWKVDYLKFLDLIKSEIDGDRIFDVTVGVFRMGQDYFQHIRKSKPESNIYYQPYENKDGVVTIPQVERKSVEEFIRKNLDGFISQERIHFWI